MKTVVLLFVVKSLWWFNHRGTRVINLNPKVGIAHVSAKTTWKFNFSFFPVENVFNFKHGKESSLNQNDRKFEKRQHGTASTDWSEARSRALQVINFFAEFLQSQWNGRKATKKPKESNQLSSLMPSQRTPVTINYHFRPFQSRAVSSDDGNTCWQAWNCKNKATHVFRGCGIENKLDEIISSWLTH